MTHAEAIIVLKNAEYILEFKVAKKMQDYAECCELHKSKYLMNMRDRVASNLWQTICDMNEMRRLAKKLLRETTTKGLLEEDSTYFLNRYFSRLWA